MDNICKARGDRSGRVPILCLFAYSSFTGAVVHGDRILGRNRTVIPVYRSHIQLHWINYEIMNSREIFRSSAQGAHGKGGTL